MDDEFDEEEEDDEEVRVGASRVEPEVVPLGWHRFYCDAATGIDNHLHSQHHYLGSLGLHVWKGQVGAWHCTECGSSDPPPAHLVVCPKPLRRHHKWRYLSSVLRSESPDGLGCVHCGLQIYPWQPTNMIETDDDFRSRPGYVGFDY